MATAKAKKKRRRRIRIAAPGTFAALPGERKAHVLRFPNMVWEAIDHQANWKKHSDAKFDTLGAVYDHAIQWFIQNPGRDGFDEYQLAISQKNKDSSVRSFWINTEMYRTAVAIAERDGVAINRLIYTAVILYLRHLDSKGARTSKK